jgi:uncharacterized membrane protein YdjX (TVP38/TMEM64 family)
MAGPFSVFRARRSTLVLAGGLGLVAGGAGAWFAWQALGAPDPGELIESARRQTLAWLNTVPVPLYLLAFAVLPALGFPLTFFYLTVGAVMGGLWLGVLVAWGCIATNVALAYGMTRGLAHPLIERLVRRREIVIPRVTPGNRLRITLLLRLSPLPFGLQNFVLALGRVPFPLYMVVSVAVQSLIGTGVIVFGDSILRGRFGLALMALFAILLLSLVVSGWRRRQLARRRGLAADEPRT